MASIEATPRYRNFSNNMPISVNPAPRAPSSLITVEKEPERDPEEDCFMCRQAHVYVKPIGMLQERRVARRHPPPLTRVQIDELSQKKQLTKQEVRKLLQCYFPDIKGVKYFQLHKYHSCCYDPKHLNLCKNHITALQHEREQHPNHNHHENEDENHYNDYERDSAKQNRVSFVRIKIEPTKGIPTRFLGPTALPESLADMLIKQVNRLENKKKPLSFSSNYTSQPYNIRRINDPYDDDEGNDEEDDSDDDDNQITHVKGKVMTEFSGNYKDNKQEKAKLQTKSTNGDLVVEDLDELNRLYIDREKPIGFDDNSQKFSKSLNKKKRKKVTSKKNLHGHHKPKLNHWELLALEQSKQETCNCRHHVMRREADQVFYDWCRCKDHQHKDLMERRKSIALPPSSPPKEPTPPPPSPPPPPKPRKVRRKRLTGINATQPETTELALAYDPSTVDYDMIQEVIYYRTTSGRLIKPEMTNAFTYDGIPPRMTINNREPIPTKAEVLYMTPNGQLQPFEGDGQRRGKTKSAILSNPVSLYNGSITSSKQHFSDNNSEHQPAEFTLPKFNPDKSVDTPTSRRSPASDSQGRLRTVSISKQKSTKPTYSNLEPTPDYGRESSVVANRRWFDQPLGDQNLRPVHDGQYGLIAGTSAISYNIKRQSPTTSYNIKRQSPTDDFPESDIPKNGSNCTIS